MLISYTHRFIFFHVAKVAGLSLRNALRGYTQEPEKFKIKRPLRQRNGQVNPLYAMWESALTHATARETQKELGEPFNQFYKFAFVRNPWDWQVSMYHFLLKETTNPRYGLVKSMAGFEDYLEWVIRTEHPYPKGATKLQKDMLADENGQLLVDFVGRFETLAEDFAHVCRVLKLEASLPHLNRSHHADYCAYYNERTRRLVADYFQADIELFGYTFEGCKGVGGKG
jgi:hypothetical protein